MPTSPELVILTRSESPKALHVSFEASVANEMYPLGLSAICAAPVCQFAP